MSTSQHTNNDRLRAILNDGCASLALTLSDTQKQQLVDYVLLIDKWNKAYNLTSVRQPEEMMVKHILDSLSVVPQITGKTIIDVGTGPGLPGIPLAIALPQCQLTLLDSLGKRVRFLKQAIFSLGLKNTVAVQSRVEDHQVSAPYDIVISRAFASLKDMLHWCQHLVDSTGAFFALKGQFPQSEIDEVSDHFQIRATHDLRVPGLDGERHLVIIGKV